MNRSVLTLASISTLALSLAACGGGGGGITPNQPTAPSSPTTPQNGAKATASISFKVPLIPASNVGTSSAARRPQDLSPGTDKISFIVDGTSIFKDVEVANYNNANGGAGVFNFANGQSITLAYGAQATYFTVTLGLSVLPGRHTFGVVLKSGTPAYVLSEGQATYTLNPGANDLSANPLALSGVVASGYISCDTEAENTTDPSYLRQLRELHAGNGCFVRWYVRVHGGRSRLRRLPDPVPDSSAGTRSASTTAGSASLRTPRTRRPES